MKMLRLAMLVYVSALLSGCLYGQCMDGPCALEHSRILKSIKSYGQYWTKPTMSTESWRQDWVACGGDSNGQYGVYTPPGSPTKVVLAAQKQEARRLDACMQSKGYEFSYAGPTLAK